MEKLNDIPGELNQLSPFLAGLEKVNVFTVPSGYFDEFSNQLIGKLRSTVNFDRQAMDQPAVPEGYFEQLSDTIMSRIKNGDTANDEIKMLSPTLYPLRAKNVFLVPDNYFETTPAAVLNQVKEIASEELRQLSTELFNIRDVNVFEVPAGYFDELAPKIAARLSTASAKVVSLSPVRNLWRYAVAAMVTGVIAFGVYKITDGPAGTISPGLTAVKMDATIERGINMNDRQFNEAMLELSDTDIVNYLETNGDIADITALRNTIDEEKLPDPEEYLLNNKTLDNYLKEIQLSLTN